MYNERINCATAEYPFLIKHTNVKYIPHFHEEPEVVYVIAGELTFTLGLSSYRIAEGDICIIPSKFIHNLYTDNYSETFVMKLYPSADLSNVYLEHHIVKKGDSSYDALLKYVSNIIREDQEKKDHYKLAVNINADNILLYILRKTKYQTTDSKVISRRMSDSSFLDRINAFLEERYCEEFSLDDIAGHLNYTKSYFCRYFKKATGTTFWEYYTMFRLEKSIHYMQDFPKETLSDIAHKSGFRNVRSFYEAFHNYHRCTPKEYRKMLQKL